jgi:hypothetical protein
MVSRHRQSVKGGSALNCDRSGAAHESSRNFSPVFSFLSLPFIEWPEEALLDYFDALLMFVEHEDGAWH